MRPLTLAVFATCLSWSWALPAFYDAANPTGPDPYANFEDDRRAWQRADPVTRRAKQREIYQDLVKTNGMWPSLAWCVAVSEPTCPSSMTTVSQGDQRHVGATLLLVVFIAKKGRLRRPSILSKAGNSPSIDPQGNHPSMSGQASGDAQGNPSTSESSVQHVHRGPAGEIAGRLPPRIR